jgi:hypothetical protein
VCLCVTSHSSPSRSHSYQNESQKFEPKIDLPQQLTNAANDFKDFVVSTTWFSGKPIVIMSSKWQQAFLRQKEVSLMIDGTFGFLNKKADPRITIVINHIVLVLSRFLKLAFYITFIVIDHIAFRSRFITFPKKKKKKKIFFEVFFAGN